MICTRTPPLKLAIPRARKTGSRGPFRGGLGVQAQLAQAISRRELRRRYDKSQEIAKAYRAACTPDFFLFDKNRRLVYRGQMDDSRPGNNIPVTGTDLTAAVEAVLARKPVNPDQKPSIGCNIKWKPGNAPGYYA